MAVFGGMGVMFKYNSPSAGLAWFIVIILIWELIEGVSWNIWAPLKWSGFGGLGLVGVALWLLLLYWIGQLVEKGGSWGVEVKGVGPTARDKAPLAHIK